MNKEFIVGEVEVLEDEGQWCKVTFMMEAPGVSSPAKSFTIWYFYGRKQAMKEKGNEMAAYPMKSPARAQLANQMDRYRERKN